MNPVYSKLSPSELSSFVSAMIAAIGSGSSNPFGIDHSLVPLLQSENDALVASTVTAEAAKRATTQAVLDRDAKASYVIGLANQLTRVALASSASDAQLASLGLSRPSSSRARIVPRTPAEVTASVQENGNIVVRFKRNGNPNGVVFQIEAMTAGVWETAAITTAAKAELEGYVPGQAVAFRVVAQKSGQSAPPSPTATAYGSAVPAPALRLAA